MSSDSDSEPTSPKHRRLTPSHCITSSSSNDSASSSARSSGGRRYSSDSSDNLDIYVLSDSEFDKPSPSGRSSSETRSNDGRPCGSSSVAPKDDDKSSKRSSESGSNAKRTLDVESKVTTDSQTETCPICFVAFANQEVATPSICNHNYCFACLMEWSKTMNTCPVDRQTFNSINVRPKFGSNVTRHVPVETRVTSDADSDEDTHELESEDDDDDVYSVFETGEDTGPPSEDGWNIIEAMNDSSAEVEPWYPSDVSEDENSIPIMELSSSDDYEPDDDSNVIISSSSDEDVIFLS